MPPSTRESNTFTPADRIRELGEIDARIPQALSAASFAVRSVVGEPTEETEPDSSPSDPQAAFERHTTVFYAQVQAITALLRRQAYALEEAGIISASKDSNLDLQPPPPPPSALGTAGRAGLPVAGGGRPAMGLAPAGSGQVGKEVAQMPIINGGLGNLDIGWLNSRRDTIGKQKEAELWKEARRMLAEMVEPENGDNGRSTTNGNAQQVEGEDEDDMDVDVDG